MKSSLVLLILCSALVAAAPTTAPSSEVPTTAPTVASDEPINKKCPINTDEDIDKDVTTIYKGKKIAFCCKACIPKFEKDPEKYMKDLK